MFFSCDHLITVINLNLRVMWYNRVVTDNNGDIIIKERIFIINGSGGDSFGMDILGNWVEEWWEGN